MDLPHSGVVRVERRNRSGTSVVEAPDRKPPRSRPIDRTDRGRSNTGHVSLRGRVTQVADTALATGDAVAELFDRASERGYVLLSELEELRDPLIADEDWMEEALSIADDRGLDIVDDVGEDEEREAPASTEVAMTHSSDPVRAYLDAAGRVELLTAEEEADLAKRFEAGRLAAPMLDSRRKATPRQRAKLNTIRREGDRAKEAMVKANLRLVVAQAKNWVGRDMDMIELIQEGNLGLIRAVEKFDHTKGYKFSTYAVWWIRQALQRGVAGKARTIRVPSHVWETSAKLRRTEVDLRQKLGRDPKDVELAEAAGITVERLHEVREALQRASSLDRPVGEEGDTTLGELIADIDAINPEVTVSADDARSRIEGVLHGLDERERKILELRFGFVDGEPRTLDEIGQVFGMSRERIRQIEKQALARLRHSAAGDALSPLLDAIAAA
jgi:RNA polymerase sigma factor (sigma-70 family)